MANVNPHNASVMVVYGCNDVRVASAAVNAYFDGGEPWVIISGGFGRLSRQEFVLSEAETFAEQMQAEGVPSEKLVLENHATNTGENTLFSKHIIEQSGFDTRNILLVCKNIMRPRVWASAQKFWFDDDFSERSLPLRDRFADYVQSGSRIQIQLLSPTLNWLEFNQQSRLSKAEFIANVEHNRAMMVGEIDRLVQYPRLGHQISLKIPETVLHAQQFLVKKGYGKYLLSS
ncbi:YdcF family protein [Sessilibacter sp. MAH4]